MYFFKSRLWRMYVHWRTKLQAWRDAKLRVTSVDIIVHRWIGPRPEYDPVGNPEHQQIEQLLSTKEINAWVQELRGVDKNLTHHPSPVLLRLAVGALFGGEFVGASLILRDLGVNGTERVPFALMLATAMFFLTWLAARTGGKS